MKIKQWITRWHTFWTATGPPHALAVLRISFGLFLMIYAATYLPWWRLMLTDEGLVMPFYDQPWLQALSPTATIMVLIAFGITLICFTIGLWFRLVSWLMVGFAHYYWQLHLHVFPTSYNRLFLFALIILACSGANRTYSVDAWRRQRKVDAWVPVPLWPQHLLALQVSVTYLGVGWLKLVFQTWQGGEILAYSFIGLWSTPISFWMAQFNAPLVVYDWSVQIIKAFEVLLPFGLWYRPQKRYWIYGAMLFQFLIAVLMSIWWFPALYPLYILFLRPEATQAWCEKRLSIFRKSK